MGRILLMNGQTTLDPGQSCFVQIRLEDPLPLAWQDRFIARSESPMHVIGGGLILRAHPRRRTMISADEQALLEALLGSDESAICAAAVALMRDPFRAQDLADFAGVEASAAKRFLTDKTRQHQIVSIGEDSDDPYHLTHSALQKQIARIENALLEFHVAHPLQTGCTKGALQKACGFRGGSESFDALLFEAQRSGRILILASEICHPQAGSGAKRLEEQAVLTLYELLRNAADTPPTTAELLAQSKLDQSLAHRALNSLEKQGRIKRISSDFCFDSEILDAFAAKTKAYLNAQGQGSVAQLKDVMGVSRKYAVPLLEYFDARGLTKRSGDTRILL
jgi:selenocysteine-specific elongation factor